MISLDFSPNNWDLIWELQINQNEAAYPRQICPSILESPILLIQLNLVDGFHTKRLGGYLTQTIPVDLIGINFAGARTGSSKKVFVGETQIIIFDVLSNYNLSFDMLTRISSNGKLSVFEYTGEIT